MIADRTAPADRTAAPGSAAGGIAPERLRRRVVRRWTIGSVCFGLAFSLIGLAVVASGLSWEALVAAHGDQPVLYIVQLAPIVLGSTGYLIGHNHGDLVLAKLTVERAVAERTRDLEVALHDLGRAQAQLLQAQKLESIGQLAAGIAHEINSPIQFVGDNTRFVADAVADLTGLAAAARAALRSDPVRRVAPGAVAEIEAMADDIDLDYLLTEIPRALDQTIEGIARVAGIVRAMKDFAHAGGDDKLPIHLDRALEATIAVARNEWKFVAEVVTDVEPDLPAVYGRPGPLKQVLLIVLVNAAQAIAEVVGDGSSGKGTINIAARSDGGWVQVDIADTGAGIPPEVQPRIFDPFFSTKDVGAGSGQGLSIAYQVVVVQHGGRLEFTTEAGVGTTFHIRLPVLPAETAPPNPVG